MPGPALGAISTGHPRTFAAAPAAAVAPAAPPGPAPVAVDAAALIEAVDAVAPAFTAAVRAAAAAGGRGPFFLAQLEAVLVEAKVPAASRASITAQLFHVSAAAPGAAPRAREPGTASPSSMEARANALQGEGKYDEALALHREVLAIKKAASRPSQPDIAASLAAIGSVLCNQWRWEEALDKHRQALEIWRAVLGPQHSNVAASLTFIAEILRNQGKLGEALTTSLAIGKPPTRRWALSTLMWWPHSTTPRLC